MSENRQLLAEYVENGSEAAFRQLVERYIDLVYSSAVRLVNGDVHLAQDVTQTVFADFARMARKLGRDAMIGGWLHRHTCFVASKVIRGERRRQMRERQAVEMNAMEDHSAANLAVVAPVLDEAINELGAADRQAILLRFFEQRDFRSVGNTLGSNEEAARKRVNRALEKLHSLLARRGVALSVAALGATLTSQAVTAAPAGIAAGIATTALAGATTGGGMALTIFQVMSMTKVKCAVAGAIVLAAAVPYAIQHKENAKLRDENETLRQQVAAAERLAAENERLSRSATLAADKASPTNQQFHELLKLRGEVGKLRQENATVAAAIADPKGPSALSSVTGNPEMMKVIRTQQRLGMGVLYKELGKRLNLPSEQSEKLVDVLTDDVMENVGHIMTVLQEKKPAEERDRLFAAQEAVLQEKLQALLGPDGFSQYQEYTRNLLSQVTSEQFKGMLTGEKPAKEEQARLLFALMEEEKQRLLQTAGLGGDYQLIPTLNFRNFVSESEAERNLQLLDTLYTRVAERAGSFLSAEEIKKFGEFRASAINGNRLALTMNRKLMSPTPQ